MSFIESFQHENVFGCHSVESGYNLTKYLPNFNLSKKNLCHKILF